MKAGPGRAAGALALLLGFTLVSACKTSEDAAAAAAQLTTTAKDLCSYYAAIDTALNNTQELSELQNVLYQTPLDEQYLAQLKDARAEIQKRADAAKALEELADSFSKLTGAKAASDGETAANKLGQELVSIKALPTGPPIPEGLGAAGHEAMTLIEEHKEKQAAAAMEHILSALSDLFTKEKPAYESIYRDYVALAHSISTDMVRRKQLDTSTMLTPALEPFHLSAQVRDEALSDALRGYALQQIDSQSMELNGAQAKASDAMEQALAEMGTRLHQLATEKMLKARGAPLTLGEVEQWISSVS